MQQALSLLELNKLIRSTLDQELLPSYWVIAEIGEIKNAAQGHAYLELVEKNNNRVEAKIRANIWAYSYRTIAGNFRTMTGQELKAGMKILALVNVTFHEIYGISLNIKDIDPNYTLGERAKIRQEIIEKLTKEGAMELNKRFELPVLPQKIAVISSASAAGFGDFVNQLQENKSGYKINFRLFQATMQGADAPASIINALDNISVMQEKEGFQLLVIIRGGGAQLDLDCFDDYDLALAIAKQTIPVITGIGHERDETIADMVAHTKMKTPTAVAEFILSGFRDFEDKLNDLLKRLERATAQTILWEDRNLRDLESRISAQSTLQIQKSNELLKFKSKQLQTLVTNRLYSGNIQIHNLYQRLQQGWKMQVEAENNKLDSLQKAIHRLDPETFFEKGYTRTEVNSIPIHQTDLKAGDTLLTFGKNITVQSKIEKIEEHGKA